MNYDHSDNERLKQLVDREGAACTAGEIIDALWEEGGAVKNLKSYLRQLTKDLLDCDYYRLLDGDAEASGDYNGEYMKQYSWAEWTAARLQFGVLT
ncbi:MAG: hypothetical protein IJ608_01925 [Lachnospiraceae bacterium]|nr:hypothetical protein [Lachnospiraceae bacterium]